MNNTQRADINYAYIKNMNHLINEFNQLSSATVMPG